MLPVRGSYELIGFVSLYSQYVTYEDIFAPGPEFWEPRFNLHGATPSTYDEPFSGFALLSVFVGAFPPPPATVSISANWVSGSLFCNVKSAIHSGDTFVSSTHGSYCH